VISTFATGFGIPSTRPLLMAWPSTSGNLYVTNPASNTVNEVTPTGAVSTFASVFNDPEGLAFDSAVTSSSPTPSAAR